jgi:nicotinate-nucleotide--dimethylbenzimidazole phosphoribosyltransferase
MDARLLILAATFGLFIASLIAFVVVLVRSRRPLPAPSTQLPWNALPAAPVETVDTSLAGLTVEPSAESPSAALLTPLRAGQWIPPEEPAPAEQLPSVALEERIASFEPAPEIPEPAFAAPHYQVWEVGDGATSTENAASEPIAAPEPVVVPEPVVAPEPVVVPEPVAVPEPIAAPEPVAVPEPVVAPEPVVVPEPVAVPEADVVPPVWVPPSVPEVVPAADVVAPPLPEPVAAPAVAAVADVGTARPFTSTEDDFSAEIAALLPSIADVERSVPRPAPNPVQPPGPAPVPAVAATPASPSIEVEAIPVPPVTIPVIPEPVAPASVVEAPVITVPVVPVVPDVPDVPPIEAVVQPRPVAAPVAQREDRPIAVVAPRPEPVAEPVAEIPVAPVPSRPRAVVRAFDGSEVVDVVQVPATRAASPFGTQDREVHSEDLVMAAPVEMWFGDARIGVKAGTPTYDRFRKYADVLLADLKASR